ncbi:hypothetical protein [Plasticicumulans acidivorans]|nr:hypothetical protein [Plasticicumulans acidivorans]
MLITAIANAAPVLIAYDSIDPTSIETFESYPSGPTDITTFNGFSFIPSIPYGIAGICRGYYCPSAALIASIEVFEPPSPVVRQLTGFAPGTTQVGLLVDSFWRLAHLYSPAAGFKPDAFIITVIGNSGTSDFALTLTEKTWFAFEDQTGLLEISFANYGSHTNDYQYSMWNYLFDDIITFSPIPEPPSAFLVASGLIVSASLRRYRRRNYRRKPCVAVSS